MATVRRTGYALGAEITGIDLRRPLDDATLRAVRDAWLEHVVVCFPGQELDATHMQAFCAQFGELDGNRGSINRDPAHPEVLSLSNKPVVIGETRAAAYTSNHWHADNSHTPRPTTITFLLAKDLPDTGGDTMFANTIAAYDALSPAYKAAIDPLFGVDDYTLGRAYAASTPAVQERTRAAYPPVVHQLARVHEETGRRALYVGNRVRRILGMTGEESAPFISFLKEHASRSEFIYRHRWRVNDLVLWDNRSALHYAVPDYDSAQLRRMIRCSLTGPIAGRLESEIAVAEAVPA